MPKTWEMLKDKHLGARAIVVGNGPSRGHLPERGAEIIAAYRASSYLPLVVIGSNTQWDEPFSDQIDYFVCYDLSQIRLAMTNTRKPVLVPSHRVYSLREPIPPTPTKLSCAEAEGWLHRLFSIDPHAPRLEQSDKWATPLDCALGNFSGVLAYQAAWVMGCREVILLGMDCSIEAAGGTGKRTCVSTDSPGYENSLAFNLKQCFDADGVLVPRSWRDVRGIWRFLTENAARRDIATFRGYEHGSLSWIPTKDKPGSELPLAPSLSRPTERA
jgi:hypothetical protein